MDWNDHNIVYLLFSSLSSPSACVSPSDPTLTVEKVTEVMGEVGDRERVWGLLGVPASKQAEITQQSSTEGEKSRALSQYWVNCYPDASWERLASALYFRGEERAAVMAGQYLPMKGACISWPPEIGLVCCGVCILMDAHQYSLSCLCSLIPRPSHPSDCRFSTVSDKRWSEKA